MFKKKYRQVLLKFIAGLILGLILSRVLRVRVKRQDGFSDTLHEAQETQSTRDKDLADQLFDKVKIVCLIMTRPNMIEVRARHVFNTWGKHCNKLVFFSSESNETQSSDDDMEIVSLPVPEGRSYLWLKAKEMFKYTYFNLFEEGEWFFKADDDSFAVMENFRYMLYPLSSSYPIAFGYKLTLKNESSVYFAGGSGYIMSKAALVKLVEDQILKGSPCYPNEIGNEDTNIGKCLTAAGVVLANDQDENGLRRFVPFKLHGLLFISLGDVNSWFWRQVYYKPRNGFDCCSEHCAGFHYITGDQQYFTYYLVYHLRPFGLTDEANLPMRMSSKEMDIKYNIIERRADLVDSNGTLIRSKLL